MITGSPAHRLQLLLSSLPPAAKALALLGLLAAAGWRRAPLLPQLWLGAPLSLAGLHVPGAHQVVREHLRQVEAEEVVDLRPVVLRGRAASDQDRRLSNEVDNIEQHSKRLRPLVKWN